MIPAASSKASNTQSFALSKNLSERGYAGVHAFMNKMTIRQRSIGNRQQAIDRT